MAKRQSRRRRGMISPIWAPMPMHVDVEAVSLLGDWVMLRECFEQDRARSCGDVVLEIPLLGTPNTVYGTVVKGHSELAPGTAVIYREWEGGRWDFNGDVVLILRQDQILARVEDDDGAARSDTRE